MPPEQVKRIDRRSFLLSIGRYSAAGMVLGGTGRLVFSRRGGEKCVGPALFDCDRCAALGSCTLAAAIAFKGPAVAERDAGGGDVRSQR